MTEPVTQATISVEVDGERYERDVDARRLLVHFLRDELDLTGTHVGCDTGNCGACTVLLDGHAIKSCMMLAIQADGTTIETVEGMTRDGELHPLQQAFGAHHALQCGYCTPGMLMRAYELIGDNPEPTAQQVREGIASNLCRCTGYQYIVEAVLDAAERIRADTLAHGQPFEPATNPATGKRVPGDEASR
jgi:aerobic carbon-monoxide dehydrogenase small subunit